MLVVKTYLDRSRINGIGVFAKEAIPANALVWEFTPSFDLELNLNAFPPLVKEFLRHYGNPTSEGLWLLCGDHARFMNHSDTPNMSASDDKNYALRDIAAGEEITCNYREFDVHFQGFPS